MRLGQKGMLQHTRCSYHPVSLCMLALQLDAGEEPSMLYRGMYEML